MILVKCRSTLFLAAACSCFAVGHGAIMSEDERAEKMDAIRAILNGDVRPVEKGLLESAPSPFIPSLGKFEASEGVKERVALTGDELLRELSKYVNPTGIFLFGGDFYLVFKENRKEVGSEIKIMYEGTEYSVTISEITGSSYVIRRGDSELQLKLK